MQQLLKFGLIFTIASSGLLFAACEDGEPGAIGAQGDKGDKGDIGDTGANGESYDELTKYGNIVVQYKGIGVDDVAFNQTVDFKFSTSGPDLSWQSSVSQYNDGEGGSGIEFSVYRFQSAIIDSRSGYIRFNFYKPTDGSESSIYTETEAMIVSDDKKSFPMYLRGEFPFSQTASEYSFSTATSELTFKFKTTIPTDDEYNYTNHEIEISADAKVKVVQNIDTPK
jgi:hypothetical protein